MEKYRLITLPETKQFAPDKMAKPPKGKFIFRPSIFRCKECKPLVSPGVLECVSVNNFVFCMLEAIYQWPDGHFLGGPHFVGAHVFVKINIIDKILK